MKKLSLLPSILFVLTIMTLGLSSCSQKYGCYYSETQQFKDYRDIETPNWISNSETDEVEEAIITTNCTSTAQQ